MTATVVTWEGLKRRSEFAASKIRNRDYSHAIEDLTHIVDNLIADNDQRAVLKMSSFNNRALCFLELGDTESCRHDASLSLALFESMRPQELDRRKAPRKNDPLRPQLHFAFARLGQAYEGEGAALDAIANYRRAIDAHPRGPAQDLLDSCYLSYGIPHIDISNPTLRPYTNILEAMGSADDLSRAFHEIVTHVNANPLDEATVQMLNRHKIPQLFLGVINFQLESELCVDIGLTLACYFMWRGGDTVWLNHKVIGTILTNFPTNLTIMLDCLHILSCLPQTLNSYFARREYLEVYLKMFQLDLEDNDIMEVFAILYRALSVDESAIGFVKGTDLFDQVLRYRNPNALMVMTRMSKDPDVARRIRDSEAVDWMFELLANPDTNSVLIESVVVTFSYISHLTDVGADVDWDGEKLARQIFESLVPICRSYYKTNLDIVVRAFQVFTDVLKNAHEKAAEMKVIALASVLLILFIDQLELVLVDVTFLWACADQGLIAELRQVERALPNMMKALEKYTLNQWIVERCIGFAVLMDHPKRMEQLQYGLRQFPNSTFLKDLTKRDDISTIIRQQLHL
jgi:tetratricopeptide (TPR) repeat protein